MIRHLVCKDKSKSQSFAELFFKKYLEPDPKYSRLQDFTGVEIRQLFPQKRMNHTESPEDDEIRWHIG